MPNLLNMPVKYCKDENDNEFSPVVYQESMFNDDGTRMDPVPRKMFAKAYDPTKTYPTENLFCIQDNKYYKFTGSGTTTGTFDPTKWTETDDATELTQLNNTLAGLAYGTIDNKIMWCTNVKTCMIKFDDGVYTANANGIIATLPANCKPYVSVDFRDSYSQKRIQINTDGEIITVEALSNTIIRGTVTYILS